MKIGIYGGSFDPIHTGHAMLANFVAQCGIVDEVWLMVSRKNPLKENHRYTDDFHRLNMAKIVASKCKNVLACDFELSLPSPSFTCETLKELTNKYPQHQFVIIIGSDSFIGLTKWKEIDYLKEKFGFIVYPRPGYPLKGIEPANTVFLTGAPEYGMSSSLIREYIRDNWNIDYFVPVEVADYIRNHNLYQEIK